MERILAPLSPLSGHDSQAANENSGSSMQEPEG